MPNEGTAPPWTEAREDLAARDELLRDVLRWMDDNDYDYDDPDGRLLAARIRQVTCKADGDCPFCAAFGKEGVVK